MSAGPLHLTFDDGPDPVWTPAVLALLRRAGVTATFFVLGRQVARHPGLVADIVGHGHTVGLHGHAHLDHAAESPEAVAQDTTQALRVLRRAGVQPTLWRLPWGRRGPESESLAAEHGLTIVGWDADTHDWRGDRPGDQPAAVTRAAATGGVVLLHDGIGPGATRTDCTNTLELTEALLSAAAEARTPVTAIPKALAYG